MTVTVNSLLSVSVIIPTYNRAHCLGRAISSVVAQTYTNWELIIVDNNSTDDTDEVVRTYRDERIKLLKIENDGIIASSRNMGIDVASGEYVAFLDSDDWWFPDKLRLSVNQLQFGADIVYHDMYQVSALPPKLRHWKRAKTRALTKPVFPDLLFGGNAIVNSSVVVKIDLMRKIKGFAENSSLVAVEDYDAWLRLAQHTDSFVRIPKLLGCYWSGGENYSAETSLLQHVERIGELFSKYTYENKTFTNSPMYFYLKGRAYIKLERYEEASNCLVSSIVSSKLNKFLFNSIIWLFWSKCLWAAKRIKYNPQW